MRRFNNQKKKLSMTIALVLIVFVGLAYAFLNEKLIFDDKKVDFYRNDMSKPAASSEYAFEGSEINVPSLGIVMKPQLLTEKYYVFVEKSNSLVWELMKA